MDATIDPLDKVLNRLSVQVRKVENTPALDPTMSGKMRVLMLMRVCASELLAEQSFGLVPPDEGRRLRQYALMGNPSPGGRNGW